MSDEMGILNGNGKKQYINLKDPQHWNVMISGTTLVAIITAIFIFADMRNEWKNHKATDTRRWEMTWTLPEMISYANAATKATKMEMPDPYATAERFKKMKENN